MIITNEFILQARKLNESLNNSKLLLFDNSDSVDFTKSNSKGSKNNLLHTINEVIIEELYNGILEYSLFIPTAIPWNFETDKTKYIIDNKVQSKLLISSEYTPVYGSSAGLQFSAGVLFEINGTKVTINIIGHPRGPFIQLTASSCVLWPFIESFVNLKTLPNCRNLEFDTFNYCIPVDAFVLSFTVNKSSLDHPECPKHINIIDNFETQNSEDYYKQFTGPIVTNRFTGIVKKDYDAKNLGIDDLKANIEYMKSNGFLWPLLDPAMYNQETFSNNLYYDYDLPGLDDYIENHGIRFNHKDIISIDSALIGSDRYGIQTIEANKIKARVEKLNGESNLKHLLSNQENNDKQIDKYINQQLTRFAMILYHIKLPFSREYLEYNIRMHRLSGSYEYYQFNVVTPASVVMPIFNHINSLTNYTITNILDRMEMICRYVLKYGTDKIGNDDLERKRRR